MLRILKLSDYAASLMARLAPKPEGISQAGVIAETAHPPQIHPKE